jgi:hypothetical protein
MRTDVKFIPISGSILGADDQALGVFGDYLLGDAIHELDVFTDAIDKRMEVITWSGPDATEFEQNWQTVKNTIKTTIDQLLMENGTLAKSNAQGQFDASSVGRA